MAQHTEVCNSAYRVWCAVVDAPSARPYELLFDRLRAVQEIVMAGIRSALLGHQPFDVVVGPGVGAHRPRGARPRLRRLGFALCHASHLPQRHRRAFVEAQRVDRLGQREAGVLERGLSRLDGEAAGLGEVGRRFTWMTASGVRGHRRYRFTHPRQRVNAPILYAIEYRVDRGLRQAARQIHVVKRLSRVEGRIVRQSSTMPDTGILVGLIRL